MDSRIRMIVAVAVAGVASLASGSAAASTGAVAASLGSPVWGTAQEVPGTAALNQGGDAGIASVSCASAGNCSAGGYYGDSSGHFQAFVVSQVNGTWHTAIEVPGTAALNQGGDADIDSVSCASAGNCSAGGYYQDSSGLQQAFVVSQVNGTWRTADRGARHRGPQPGGDAEITSVSCASAGNCSAGGYYPDSSGHEQAFVVSEANGTWGTADRGARHRGPQPGRGRRDRLGVVRLGGQLRRGRVLQRQLRPRTRRSWSARPTAPGTPRSRCPAPRPSTRAGAEVDSVSCASAGNCSAGGDYTGQLRPLAGVRGQRGQRHLAHRHRGARHRGPQPGRVRRLDSVSCASAGNCSAGGYYTDSSGHQQAFVVSQVNGTWRTADRGARHRGPQHRRGRRDRLGVVRLGGQLQRGRVLHGQLRPPPGVRGQPGQRHLAHRDRGARHRGPQPGRVRRDHLGVVRLGGQLQRGRVLHATAPATTQAFVVSEK